MRLIPILCVIVCTLLDSSNSQRSFASTKFELNPELPIEDLTVAGLNRDEKPVDVVKPTVEETVPPTPQQETTTQPPETEAATTTTEATTTTTEATTTTTPATTATTTAPTVAPLSEPQEIVTLSPNSLAIPLSQSQSPEAQQSISVTEHNVPSSSVSLSKQGKNSTENPDKWFHENFDTTDCPSDIETISRAFRRKFPRNLLRNGKEAVLADLLSTRLRECHRKSNGNHWSRVEKLMLDSSDILPAELEECRNGLVEEQIACLNVLSYSCEFIQPHYVFRLIPTRLIVQEARFAENGADKCRKIVRKFKQVLITKNSS